MAEKPRYRAWFQSLATRRERYPLDEVVYTDRDGGLLQVVHDMDELKKTPAAAVEGALRGRAPTRRSGPTARASGARRSGCCPSIEQRERRLDVRGPHEPVLGRALRPRARRSRTSGSSSAATRHTGSFKDLGMTVLVSMVKEMRARGKPIRAVACASTGDTSAALSAYAAAAGDPRDRVPAARQDLARAADPAGRERRDRVRARHRLRRLHGDREADRRAGRHLPRELDEQPAHRGAEDGRHRDRPAVRLGGARLDRDPGRQPRQRVGAREGPRHAGRARARVAAAAHRVRAGAEREPALPRLPARLRDVRADRTRARRSPRRSRSGTRSRYEKAVDAIRRYDGIVEQASESGARRGRRARRPHRPLQLPAHGRGARRDSRSSSSAARSGAPTAWS